TVARINAETRLPDRSRCTLCIAKCETCQGPHPFHAETRRSGGRGSGASLYSTRTAPRSPPLREIRLSSVVLVRAGSIVDSQHATTTRGRCPLRAARPSFSAGVADRPATARRRHLRAGRIDESGWLATPRT